jgi:hypothetical protein
VDAFEPGIRELLRPFPRMPATANRGADRRRAATGPRVDRWFERYWNESFDRLDAYVQDLKQARQEE